MIGVRLDDDFLAEIDRVRGSMSRSDFVRMATFNALAEAGTHLSEEVASAPDRAGKGGRPRKSKPNDVALFAEEETSYKATPKKPKRTKSET